MKPIRPTLCPVCDRPMRLAAVTPRSGDRTAVQTFECCVCCVALTKAQEHASLALPADVRVDAGLVACHA